MAGENRIPKHAKKVFCGTIFSVWQWEQKQYDGSTATYEHISRADTAHTVGVLPDKQILLTWDEQPDRGPVLTPPGGRIKEEETPEQAAKREFLEETGYEIGRLIPWHSYSPMGKIDWTAHAFIGRDLRKTREPQLDAGEKVELRTFTFDEFLKLGSNPDLRDKMLRIILLEAQLDPTKKDTLWKLFYD